MFNYKKINNYKKYMVRNCVRCIVFENGYQLTINFRHKDFDLYKEKWSSEESKYVKEVAIFSHKTFEDFRTKLFKHFKGVKK